MRSSYVDFVKDDEPETVTEDLAASFNDHLTKLALPQLTSQEQFHLADIIECVATVEKHRRSMDENAVRYLLFFRQHMIRKGQAPAARVEITWREIVWAYHSGSQDILVDLVSRQFHSRMLWEHARESGVFMWMTDLTALVSRSCGYCIILLRQVIASSIRDHSTQRVHQNRREESNRLHPLLLSSQKEKCARWSLEDGSMESGAVGNAKAFTKRLL